MRVVAKCDDEATAARMLDAEEELIRGLLGDVIFGVDEQSMETVVLELLRRKGMTLAAAETITGGMLSARMSAADPQLATFRGARIDAAAIDNTGAPEQRAIDAAAKARTEFGSDVGIAVLADAGVESPPRTLPVTFAVVIGGAEHTDKAILPSDRPRLRDFAVIGLLNVLRRKLAA